MSRISTYQVNFNKILNTVSQKVQGSESQLRCTKTGCDHNQSQKQSGNTDKVHGENRCRYLLEHSAVSAVLQILGIKRRHSFEWIFRDNLAIKNSDENTKIITTYNLQGLLELLRVHCQVKSSLCYYQILMKFLIRHVNVHDRREKIWVIYAWSSV